MQSIKTYFPEFNSDQLNQFEQLGPLYREWNAKVNVISRQDIDNLEIRHILHALAIAKVFQFNPGARILDLGTGGGLPGIPLAIAFPTVRFTLVDGTGKKIAVVREIVQALGLGNVEALHSRAEDLPMRGQFDFVVSRAVAPLDKLMHWTKPLLKKRQQHAYPNGLIALKGGAIQAEIKALPGKSAEYTELFPISTFFADPWFEEKWVVYVQG